MNIIITCLKNNGTWNIPKIKIQERKGLQMVTVDQRVRFTTAFISNDEIKDEDLKQDLYLAALEINADPDAPDYEVFAKMVSSFGEIIKNHYEKKEMREERIISIGVGKVIPIDILSVPDDLYEFIRLLMR